MNKPLLPLLLLTALSLPIIATAVTPTSSASTTDAATLQVVTLNLYHDKDDWPKRRVQIVEKLKALQPDVIALQEVLQHETLTNQAEWLAQQLGYQWYFISTDPVGKPQRYGNALLTRHPILARQQKALEPLDDNRTAGMLRIDLGGRTVNLYATHLHWTDDGTAIRRRQIADLVQFIEATSDGIPSVVAGDFNATADAPELAGLRDGFVDTYGSQHANVDTTDSSTLNLKYFAAKRIDHIFFQRDAFLPMASEIIFNHADAQGTWASDHFGMFVTLKPTARNTATRPWHDPHLSPDARADALVAAMTPDEKFRYLRSDFGDDAGKWKKPAGALGSAGHVPANERLGLPAIQESDAGQGVTRGGLSGTGATSLPAMLGVAASWDPQIAYAGGAMIGSQAWRKGFNVLLAGSVNLQRDPRNGRNFEYAGEDPLLAGTIVGHAIRGVQDQKVVSTLKHFALNDLETARNTHSANLNETAAQESDLLAFRIANQIGEPGSVMCAYNKINGVYACEDPWLINQLLKREWGFKGWVMSDWGGVHSGAKAVMAGLDQQSAGEVFDKELYFDTPLRASVASGEVPQSRIDDMVHRLWRSIIAVGGLDHVPQPEPIDYDADGLISRHAAEAGMVLLRNERKLLPLSKQTGRIAVIGGHADAGVLSGGGSSAVKPSGGNAVVPSQAEAGWPGPKLYQPSSPLEEMRKLAPNARIDFADGQDRAAAIALAQAADVAVVFANQWAGESFDQPSMTLTDDQDGLIAAVAAANPRTLVVMQTNGPVRLPWLEHVDAVMEAWYPGSRGGEAIARLLFGEVDPSGRLPVTWPRNESQLPRPAIAGSGIGNTSPPSLEIDYNIEGANVGYKWAIARGFTPQYAFGHGLTYTDFAYDKLALRMEDRQLTVSFDVRNTGTRSGTDVPQVYLSLPQGSSTPLRLIGWQRLALQPGQSQRVSVQVDPRLLAGYQTTTRNWKITAGTYQVHVGKSSAALMQSTELVLADAVVE
ncbi:MAG: glycoside hydrolase family 3 C-terminal domain-containing protein [Pseudoxanthomonas sp.]